MHAAPPPRVERVPMEHPTAAGVKAVVGGAEGAAARVRAQIISLHTRGRACGESRIDGPEACDRGQVRSTDFIDLPSATGASKSNSEVPKRESCATWPYSAQPCQRLTIQMSLLHGSRAATVR